MKKSDTGLKKRISEPVKRVDGPLKIKGEAKFVDDYIFDDVLHAVTVRSEKPRAKIKSIKIPPLPSGYFIVDKNDVPGKNRVKMILDDMPFFAEDVVNYVGEPILLVVGPDLEKVYGIASRVKIEYEDLPPILSIEEALTSNKPPIYGEDNLFGDYYFEKGNLDSCFKKADLIIRDEYRTGYQEHIYLEPQGMLGFYENGRVAVYGSMQCPYYVKNALVEALGWPEDKVRVVATTTGGGFGGKEEYPSLIAGHVALAAIKTKKPVKLIFDRKEDIEVTTKRHPSLIKFRTALDDNHNIMGMDVDIILDGGAYAGLSTVVLQRAMFAATGVYRIPNVRVRGRVVATNKVPSGAFRGFGAPQAFFAIEMHMHHLAQKLGVDPLEFKLKHVLKKGDYTSTGGLIRSEVKLQEMVEIIDSMSRYRDKYRKFKKEREKLRGIGISLFFHGCGFTGKGEEIIKGKVKLRKRRDGKVEILVANVDMGQGPLTTLRKIVSHTLHIPLDDVIYENPDTDRVPDSGPTVASRTVMIVGGLLERAARELRERWNEAPELEVSRVYKHPEYIRWNQERMEGDAYPEYSWGANVVEVEVDPITYEVEVKGIWAVYDIGVAIDERIIKGQIEGGIVQGLAYALMEKMEMKNGKILHNTLTDYIIPTSKDFPKIESRLVENPYKYGPFGAKCAGELPFVGAAPAVCAAIQHALGIPVKKIPVTPEDIMDLEERGSED